MSSPSRWWSPRIHADRRPLLRARRLIRTVLRGWFESLNFVEVEAAILQASPGNEAHLHAFTTQQITPAGEPSTRYLHTSPEFACKKLLAAGEPRIFEFARVFRNRERGVLHHPEFTLLEWYRAGEDYTALMADCAALLGAAAEAVRTKRLTFRDRIATPFAEPERMTVGEAFKRFAKIDLLATVSAHGPDRDGLAAAARGAQVRVSDDDTWSDI